MNTSKTKKVTVTGMLGALASAVMFFELNVPFIPPFLKFDFSDIPAIIGAAMFSPSVGVLVLLIKNLIHLFVSSTGGVGEAANCVIGCAYIIPIAFLWKKRRSAAVICGILLMTVTAMLANYYVLIPLYEKIMPIEQILQMCGSANPNIDSVFDYVIFGVAPFNILKGTVNLCLSAAVLKCIPKRLLKNI